MKTCLALALLFGFTAWADDDQIRQQEKRVKDRQQELKDAQDYGNPAKEMRKQMRLDEEKAELKRLKQQQSK